MVTYSVTVYAMNPTPSGYVTGDLITAFTIKVPEGYPREKAAEKKLHEIAVDTPLPEQYKFTFTDYK